MIRKLSVGAAALTLVMFGSVRHAAAVEIKFDQLSDFGGTISSDGSTVTGTNIIFDYVIGTDGISGQLFCSPDCYLNFTSGVYDSSTGTYGAGGYFTVTGTLYTGTGGTGTQIATGTLLTGTFTSGDIALGTFFIGVGPDTKNAALLAWFGLPTTTLFRFADTNIAGFGTMTEGGVFSTSVREADIVNTAVPEPGSMVLLGSGLFALASVARRRFGRK
jgi:hypothetical protein